MRDQNRAKIVWLKVSIPLFVIITLIQFEGVFMAGMSLSLFGWFMAAKG